MANTPNTRSGTQFVTQDKDGKQTAADLVSMTGIGQKAGTSAGILMDLPLNLISNLHSQTLTVSAPGLQLKSAVNLLQGNYRLIVFAVPLD